MLHGFTALDPAIRTPIAISLGAIPGALSRYYLTTWSTRWLGTDFPYGTFLINLTGSLLMGFFTTYILERAIASPDLRLFVAVGFLGSYTTFSTYALDTNVLIRNQNYATGMFYWLGSALLGAIFLEMGGAIARLTK